LDLADQTAFNFCSDSSLMERSRPVLKERQLSSPSFAPFSGFPHHHLFIPQNLPPIGSQYAALEQVIARFKSFNPEQTVPLQRENTFSRW
jgi:hypothetical protein